MEGIPSPDPNDGARSGTGPVIAFRGYTFVDKIPCSTTTFSKVVVVSEIPTLLHGLKSTR